MHRVMAIVLPALLSTGTAAAPQSLPDTAPAYAVGRAHAMLGQAAPCFPRDGRGREVAALLATSLARLARYPGYEDAYQRGMADTQRQQRYIPRSDPVACNEIGLALSSFVQRTERPEDGALGVPPAP